VLHRLRDEVSKMKWLFWLCAFGAIYSYVIYPLLLMLVRKRAPGMRAENFLPLVTIVIACRNEQKRLRGKIQNTLASSYGNREILVASDASDDDSDAIVAEFREAGVRLVRSPERRGKEHAQGLAIAQARGEIIVFTDAGTDLPADSIGELVESFRDAAVGAVSSEDRFLSADGRTVGEGAYVRYEMWLRQLESKRSGLVGLSGSFFAIRKSIIRTWDATIPSDFACALMATRAGLRAVANPRVHGVYKDVADSRAEYGRKVRTAIRGMTAVLKGAEVLNPFRYGMFSFQVWSHKVMRWLVPWFLLGLWVTSWMLADAGTVYRAAFWLQCAGYIAVILCHWSPMLRAFAPLRLGYYFVQVNVALATAAVQVLAGKRVVVWNPSAR
jgi:cellulose synthase/poly-beta-1,6-N-acetylglucosamine synthase-like glycosyltransferase